MRWSRIISVGPKFNVKCPYKRYTKNSTNTEEIETHVKTETEIDVASSQGHLEPLEAGPGKEPNLPFEPLGEMWLHQCLEV